VSKNESLKMEGQETAQDNNKIEDDNIIIDNAIASSKTTEDPKTSTTEKKVDENVKELENVPSDVVTSISVNQTNDASEISETETDKK
jgi:hypothetical protein